MDWDSLQQKTMNFILTTLIHHVNSLKDWNDKSKEELLNITLNVMSNSLLPDARLHWNEAIFDKVDEIKDKKVYDLLKDSGLKE